MRIREATRSDDAALRALTSACPMDGTISIRSDREPDFFRLLDRRGPHFVLAAEDAGVLRGCLSASRLNACVEGRPETVVYLGDLKVHPDARGRGWAVRLLREARERLQGEGADLVVCAAAEGNGRVLPLFFGPAGLPRAVPLGRFRVQLILPRTGRPAEEAEAGEPEPSRPELADFYNAFYRGYLFGPVVEPGRLAGASHRAIRSAGEIRAAVSLVDAADAKQDVLVGLPRGLAAAAALSRRLRPLVPAPLLPRPGERVRILYVKAMACRPGAQAELGRLLRRARAEAARQGYHFLGLGLHERDPLRRVTARIPKLTFTSLGYVIGLRRPPDLLVRAPAPVPYEDFSLT